MLMWGQCLSWSECKTEGGAYLRPACITGNKVLFPSKFSPPRIKSFCPLFFIIFLFFHQMIALQKLWKMFSISSKNLFSFSRYSNFCIFFSTLSRFERTNESEIIYDVTKGLHKFADVIFGITQKPLCIIYSNLIR